MAGEGGLANPPGFPMFLFVASSLLFTLATASLSVAQLPPPPPPPPPGVSYRRSATPAASPAASPAVPTVEIAPNVFMPLVLDGVSNRSLWIDAGGRGLDTALTYGTRDQQNVGDAIKASGLPRSAFFIVSKVPCCLARKFPFGPAMQCKAGPTGTRNTSADAEATLAAIGVEYVDLLLRSPLAVRRLRQDGAACPSCLPRPRRAL